MADRPLGPILHIIGDEAIVQPNQPFVAKGALVVTIDNKRVGKLDNPIGRVNQPYQVIKLFNSDPDLIGKLTIAKISEKKRRNRKRKRQ